VGNSRPTQETCFNYDFKNAIPKYLGKKEELKELVNRLNVFDNPVLIFVTFNN
jgi:hypothetical protein